MSEFLHSQASQHSESSTSSSCGSSQDTLTDGSKSSSQYSTTPVPTQASCSTNNEASQTQQSQFLSPTQQDDLLLIKALDEWEKSKENN